MFRFGEADGFRAHSLGVGVGLRPPHYPFVLENRPGVGWFEVITENFLGLGSGFGRPLQLLESVRENYEIVLHGVSLSLGSTDPFSDEYLKRWEALIERVQPAWVSDHLCWTGVGGQNLHDLLPLPYTEEALAHIVERIAQVQDRLKRRLLVENVSSYLTFAHSEMEEWEFLSEVARRADCGLLLDVNNIYVSSHNHGFDPLTYLRSVPRDRVGQFHLAGYSDKGTHLIDTHDHPVSDPVWELYREALRLFGDVPTLIEWDDQLPDFPRLAEEAARAESIREETLGRQSASYPKSSPASAVAP
jgi:uncharacterized protein